MWGRRRSRAEHSPTATTRIRETHNNQTACCSSCAAGVLCPLSRGSGRVDYSSRSALAAVCMRLRGLAGTRRGRCWVGSLDWRSRAGRASESVVEAAGEIEVNWARWQGAGRLAHRRTDELGIGWYCSSSGGRGWEPLLGPAACCEMEASRQAGERMGMESRAEQEEAG